MVDTSSFACLFVSVQERSQNPRNSRLLPQAEGGVSVDSDEDSSRFLWMRASATILVGAAVPAASDKSWII